MHLEVAFRKGALFFIGRTGGLFIKCVVHACGDLVTHLLPFTSTICSFELAFCGMYAYADMLQGRGRRALRRTAENATVTR